MKEGIMLVTAQQLHAPTDAPIDASPHAVLIPVTPELAAEWLTRTEVNRPLRPDAVNEYAGDMAAGRWTLTGDAICFSPEERLLNGQHRLNAIIRTGLTVTMLIMRNVPAEAMKNMDAGRKRTASDVLGFLGESNAALLSSLTRYAILWCDGRLYRDSKVQAVSHGEIVDFVRDNPDLRGSVQAAASFRHVIDLTPTALGLAHWLFARRAGSETAGAFFHALAYREALPPGSPILALDSRIREMRRNSTKSSNREQAELLVKGWNYWRSGQSVRVLQLRSKGSEAQRPEVR